VVLRKSLRCPFIQALHDGSFDPLRNVCFAQVVDAKFKVVGDDVKLFAAQRALPCDGDLV